MRGSKRALLVVAVIGTLVVTGVSAASGVTGVPTGTTAVSVAAGKTHGGINAGIHPAGAITGRITKLGSSTGIANLSITALDSRKLGVGGGYTDSQGKFRIVGLNPGKYYVCAFSPSYNTNSPYGYVSRCRGSSVYAGNYTVPSGAHQVAVSNGHTTGGANIALPVAGEIAGTYKAANGKPLNFGNITVFHGGKFFASGYAQSGAYTVIGLPAATGYKVCFTGTYAGGGTSKTGYLSECWKDAPFNGSAPSSKARSVTVRAGKKTSGVNATLGSAGAISGVVRSAAAGHKPLQYSQIIVYKGGSGTNYTSTGTNGAYKVLGVAAGTTYKVCAIGGYLPGSTGSYGGQCWHSVAWSGLKVPTKAKSVTVKNGKTTGGVNFVLARTTVHVGAISGKVTYGSAGVQYVSVTASIGNSYAAGSVSTAANGTYTIKNLPVSSSGYTVCFQSSGAGTLPGAPKTGYTSTCYKNVAWDGGPVPAHVTKVTVKSGKTHTGINAVLHTGGAISGTVKRAFGDHGAITGATIYVLNSKKAVVRADSSQSDGTYLIKGLNPSSGYTVCFYVRGTFDPTTNSTGYLNQCYKNKNWYGTPNLV